MTQKPHVGMIGLAVMGSNLAQNIESRGFPVAVYNRTPAVTDEFMQKVKGRKFFAGASLEEFVNSMERPRQVFIMVKAGAGTEAVIDGLIPLLEKGDIIIDGGNAFYHDTVQREKKCKAAGLNFLGVGISGGEEGALHGPSLMPGGPKDAWQIVQPLLEKIAAQADGPCTTYIGPDGSGHYVKMVHNGIEYGDMQLIAEAYDLLRKLGGAQAQELGEIFEDWNAGPLGSFLIEITAKIFKKHDDNSGFLVDKILDKAGQKGTGKWTAQDALELGVPIPTLSAAVDARALSSLKSERQKAATLYSSPTTFAKLADRKQFIEDVRAALFTSKVMAYAQGMALLAAASTAYKWDLKLDKIAAIWKGGCIIRAKFLDEIKRAFSDTPNLQNLLLDEKIKAEIVTASSGLRRVVSLAAQAGVPIPAFGAALSYFDSYRSELLPQNLTQAQRDFFGAHTFERLDKPGSFHALWEE